MASLVFLYRESFVVDYKYCPNTNCYTNCFQQVVFVHDNSIFPTHLARNHLILTNDCTGTSAATAEGFHADPMNEIILKHGVTFLFIDGMSRHKQTLLT